MIKTKSARVAIAQATAMGRETAQGARQGGERDSSPQILHGLDCGRVLAAMESCESYVLDWLLTAYAAVGYPGKAQATVRAQAALYLAYTRARQVRACAGKMIKMAGAVMVDYSRRSLGGDALGPTSYAELVGFEVRNWADWLKAQEVMGMILSDWDRAGLVRVGRLALGWRESLEAEEAPASTAVADPGWNAVLEAELAALLREADQRGAVATGQRRAAPVGAGGRVRLKLPKRAA